MSSSTALIAGCTSSGDENGTSDDGNEDSNGGEDDTDEESTNGSSDTTERVLIEETIYSEERIPEELSAGETLHINVDLERGTICIVDVANATKGESIFSERVRTEDEFEIPIEDDGEYYITFQGHDEAAVRAVIEE